MAAFEMTSQGREDLAQTALDLLHRQQDLVRRLLVLAEQQETYLNADHAADLLAHMQRRQQVVDDINRVQAQLTSLLPQEGDPASLFASEQLEQFRDLRDSVTDDLARIAHLDKQGEHTVRRLRDQVAARLGQVAAGQGAVAGYGRASAGSTHSNRYTDRSA